MTQTDQTPPPVKATLVVLTTQVIAWGKTQAKLARREIRENVNSAVTGAIFIGFAALIGLAAIHALAVAAIFGLALLGLSYALAALIVAAVLVASAVIFALMGRAKLSAAQIVPEDTLARVKDDFDHMQETIHV